MNRGRGGRKTDLSCLLGYWLNKSECAVHLRLRLTFASCILNIELPTLYQHTSHKLHGSPGRRGSHY